ncbi:unnamed protein product [Cyclocybe aegerita]|uniref:Mitochondrial outer membrane protein IML2 n=1 Tax=Cyclocybe aegerita TaxID=1973307 RepID=A0A8S0W163_CYCAE|nr:unnamed protein product [Cyclocybe aegerita]
MAQTPPTHPNAELLQSATKGFDFLFCNDIVSARKHFEPKDDPFHLMGLGVCAFLEAALGMEAGLMTEASRCLALSEAGARKQMRVPKPRDLNFHSRFTYGLEWEILNADAVVLLGLTHALSESYMGYLQCMYSLNSAHSKFTKLYKTVFPAGIPEDSPLKPLPDNLSPTTSRLQVSPAHPVASLGHKSSATSLASSISTTNPSANPEPPKATSSFFSRWVGSAAAAASTPTLPLQTVNSAVAPDGPVEDLVVAGTAFGYGLFNLVFSLLPKKIQGLVGFFGFKHDRKLALRALALSAAKDDVHSVFAGLVLMTYHGVVLLLSGYQANEEKLLKEYKDIVDRIESRYPAGALWILNRAKIMRMSYDAESAIRVLQDGLKPGRPHSFAQADMLLIFELAWTLLGQRRYQEAADTFMKITEINSWSHGTYYFIAAGCYIALGQRDKAQGMLDAIPDLIDKKKLSGKDLPTEWRSTRRSMHGEAETESKWVEVVKINLAEEIAIFWNTHTRIAPSIAQSHIDELVALSPKLVVEMKEPTTPKTPKTPRHKTPKSPLSATIRSLRSLDMASSPAPSSPTTATTTSTALSTTSSVPTSDAKDDLDTNDELADPGPAHWYHRANGRVSTWVGGIAMFELAVLELRDVEMWMKGTGIVNAAPATAENDDVKEKEKENGGVGLTVNIDAVEDAEDKKSVWDEALTSASAKLDVALGLAGSSIDLSSRLDTRIAMLRDEIALKREMLGIVV